MRLSTIVETSSSKILVNETSRSMIEMVVENDTSSFNDIVSSGINTTPAVVNETTSILRANMPLPLDVNVGMSRSNSKTPERSNKLIKKRERSNKSSLSNAATGNVMVIQKMKLLCNVEGRSEICEMNGDIRVNGKSSTVFMAAAASSQAGTNMVENSSWIIRPYARKEDGNAMRHVTNWSVKSGVDGYALPQCDQKHMVPAIIFSLRGYAGNNFHDYTDIVIPLYLTSRQFDGEVKFLITNKNSLWVDKFKDLLKMLSRYELINIDKEESIHCFTSVIIGLKRNKKEMKIDPSINSPHTMDDFREFLRRTYSLKRGAAIKLKDSDTRKMIKRPRILIIARNSTRTFTNTGDIAHMARRLGYNVVVAEADHNVPKIAEIVNSCDVMMGVHGAGLTNMVFLPNNAILIHVVPFGGFEWLTKTNYEEPTKDMNLRYLEYKIRLEESSLIQQYPRDHEVLRNPNSISKQGWNAFKSVYLDKQNVNIDVKRFRTTLIRAMLALTSISSP